LVDLPKIAVWLVIMDTCLASAKHEANWRDTMKKMTTATTPRVMMTVREAVHHVISDATEPLSAAEIRLRYTVLTGKRIDQSAVNKALRRLVKQGKAFARLETAKERYVRSGGEPVRGRTGRLYSTTNPVPQRARVLNDIVLGDGQATAHRRAAKPAPSAPQRDTSLIREVTRLVDRVAQLESQLAEARRVVSR